MAKKKTRKSAFVPRLLVPAVAMVAVVPAVALASCGGDNPGPATDSGYFGVAAVAYPAYESGTPDTKGDAPKSDGDAPTSDGDAVDTTTEPDTFFGVAAVAYPAYEAGKG